MNSDKLKKSGFLIASWLLASTTSAFAQTPQAQPFAMRGVELGITMAQFRQITPPNDGNRYSELQTLCSHDPQGQKVGLSSEDKADGIIECKWFSRDSLVPYGISEHWVDIGTGKGSPTFRFLEQAGQLRLFQISFYANATYYPGILDALTRGYGAAKTTVDPFQTLSGSNFTSATSVWDNRLSTITLVQRCEHLERYCLTYDHAAFAKGYRSIQESRAAAAAGKI